MQGRHVPESVLIPFLKDTPTATSQWKASSIFSKIKDVIVAVPNLPNAYSIVKGTDARMVKVEKVRLLFKLGQMSCQRKRSDSDLSNLFSFLSASS